MIRASLKLLLSANVFLPFVDGKRYVFCYHDVSEPDSPWHAAIYSTPPKLFRRQIEALSKRLQWVTLDELLRRETPGRHLCALTFDDGFASVREGALPFLRQKGIPSTMFVCRLAMEHNCLPVSTRVLLSRLRDPPPEFSRLVVGRGSDDYINPEVDEAILESLERLKASGLFRDKVFMDAETSSP
jgi:hypothetical protein